MDLGKTLLIILSMLVILIIFIALFKEIFKPTFNENEYDIITIVIQQGDTLTDYYLTYAKENTDRTEYITAIMRLNNLSSSMIYAGDTIKIYKYKTK